MRTRNRQRGSALVELTIAGIAGITLMISTVQLALAMWNYHTMAEAIHETNRYVASHGRSCTTGGNNCAITVGDIATRLKNLAIGISDSNLNLTLTSQNGVVKFCNPISTCESDSTQWPPATNLDNTPGNNTKLTATLTVHSAIVALWYGSSGTRISSITFKSISIMPIVF
jgi:hypothetical protein